ncbi:MAG: hypothetical protein LBS62_02205 [Clostridiales bacterium]|jgi:hypothetical protein|nr:hypothetical protein [Clostridiales bacterium]
MTLVTSKGFAFDRGWNVRCNGGFTVKNPHPERGSDDHLPIYNNRMAAKRRGKLDYYLQEATPISANLRKKQPVPFLKKTVPASKSAASSKLDYRG